MDPTTPGSPSSASAALGDDGSVLSTEVFGGSASASPVVPNNTSRSQTDQILRNVGVAALSSIYQFPQAPNQENSVVSEVVSAMAESNVASPRPESVLRRNLSATRGISGTSSNALGSEGASSVSQTPGADVNMQAIVQDLIERTETWQHTVTIADDGDHDDSQKAMVLDYEPSVMESHPTPSSSQDDELEDFIRFYPDEEYTYNWRNRRQRTPPGTASNDVDLEDFYRHVSYDPADVELPQTPAPPTQNFFEDGVLGLEGLGAHLGPIIHTTTYERNFTIDEFIQRWMAQSNVIPRGFHSESRLPPQLRLMWKMIAWKPPMEIFRPQRCTDDFYDVQQIPWTETLKVKRSDARALRDAWYTSYHNLDYSPIGTAKRLPPQESYFREKSMYTAHKASIEHFQLRNLMSVPAYNTVHFASRSKVFSWVPAHDSAECLIDLTRPAPESGLLGPVKISTMKSAYGVTIAGGFCGEYALRAEEAQGAGVKGLVTPDFNDGITTHVDIVRSRTGRSPMCVFASNDRHLRVLDCETNVFLSDQELYRPINCTATSPDCRLRVVIGDSPDAWVIEADTGRPVHPLRGHRDFGFACAWSPDMRHVATSNQDKTVIIWDARTWRILETIDSDIAGYRSLRFSPVGGGPRTLLCCEPADRISIVDAQHFRTRQVHDFFGEIGGADYAPDGSVIWVANTDAHFGGFMQFERRQWGKRVGVTGLPNEWVREADLDADGRCVLSTRERQLRFMSGLTDEEHEALIL